MDERMNEAAMRILQIYAVENGVIQRSTSDLSRLEEWLIVKLISMEQEVKRAEKEVDDFSNRLIDANVVISNITRGK